MARFEASAPKVFHLDWLLKKLKVEKRKIYDVFNVLEAVNAVFKIDKSTYLWMGLDEIAKAISGFEEGKQVGKPEGVRER